MPWRVLALVPSNQLLAGYRQLSEQSACLYPKPFIAVVRRRHFRMYRSLLGGYAYVLPVPFIARHAQQFRVACIDLG